MVNKCRFYLKRTLFDSLGFLWENELFSIVRYFIQSRVTSYSIAQGIPIIYLFSSCNADNK